MGTLDVATETVGEKENTVVAEMVTVFLGADVVGGASVVDEGTVVIDGRLGLNPSGSRKRSSGVDVYSNAPLEVNSEGKGTTAQQDVRKFSYHKFQ